ncbi:chemosensory receptor B [Elysia marginata]|uniref:Chemosensory receptor B n=1 Tax=Elysia marginata TaxID=1093978 RepID=A0AAV4IXU4_9GAST|nr:chemosensory receptor B [Elysia marginata]
MQLHPKIRFYPGYTASQFLFIYSICIKSINALDAWVTVILTYERLFCIVAPLKVKLVFTRTSIVCAILVGVLYEVIALAIFFYAFFHMKESTHAYTLMDNAITAGAVIPNFVFYLAIILGTALLVIMFIRSVRIRNSLRGKEATQKLSSKEMRIIKSVIGVCVLYVVTCAPLNVYDAASTLKIFIDNSFLFDRLAYLTKSFNHAGNIFVYLAINSNFRRQLISLFCPCRKLEKTTSKTTKESS